MRPPLFIPLRAEHYNAFAAGTKTTEYRRFGAGWNAETCTIGRPVTLSKGYGKANRLSGRIVGYEVAYVDDLIAARRAEPRDDFITRLVQTEVDGRRLTDVEARTQLVFLFISGNETTRHLIGNLLWRLAVTPGLLDRLASEPELIPLAVEEALRLDPPVKFLMRNCMHATELHGNHLDQGDKVAFGLASANRDSTRFDAPDEFRLDRSDPRSHLAFGGGPHVCPGAALARLEARVAVEVFVQRVAAMAPVGTGAYDAVSVFWAHGPATLPVRLTPREEPSR